jgi:hypothetical protein
MLNRIILATAITICFGMGANANSVNLVLNGSLELPYYPGSYIQHVNTSNPGDITNWTVTNSGVLVVSSYWWPASDGLMSINMDEGYGNLGTIQQAIPGLQAGHQYLLKFDYAANPYGTPSYGPPPYALGFSVGDFIGSVTDASSDPSVAWQHYSAGFTFNGSNILSFSALTQGAAVLDNVSLSETPLPSTWLMLLSGFVGLGFLAYSGTKKNAAAVAA